MPATVPLTLDPRREEAELRAYLGDRFELARLQNYAAQLDQEFRAIGNEARFYRTSSAYLYDLTAFAMTQTKLPYLRRLVRCVRPGARLLDYGCGIGSDGLALLEHGYRVEFADFDNPSIEYLRWRLARRGLHAPIHDLDADVPGGFDLAYAFDVIEHVGDPFAFLTELESRARIVQVNLLEPEPEERAVHRPLPIRRLVGHVSRRRLLAYRRFYGRSHLLVYEAGPPARAPTVRCVARLLAGRALGATGDRRPSPSTPVHARIAISGSSGAR